MGYTLTLNRGWSPGNRRFSQVLLLPTHVALSSGKPARGMTASYFSSASCPPKDEQVGIQRFAHDLKPTMSGMSQAHATNAWVEMPASTWGWLDCPVSSAVPAVGSLERQNDPFVTPQPAVWLIGRGRPAASEPCTLQNYHGRTLIFPSSNLPSQTCYFEWEPHRR